MSVKPIFIFSLPRSGSTLLQRLLSLHESIDTQAEPWLALPVFYALKDSGASGIYGCRATSAAVRGYVDSLPDGRDDYYKSAARFLNDLYERGSSKNACYFIDKTPRYHLIVDEILLAFPEAKIIFLWRNPLSIVSSMIKTWGKNKWNLYMFYVDLYSGINSLVNANGYHKNKLAVKYEDLVRAPEDEMKRIMKYLELEFNPALIGDFKDAKTIDAPGRGDPVGQYKYNSVSDKSAETWKKVMSSPFRKAWGKKYLDWIGEDRLAVMGYDLDELQAELRNCPTRYQYLLSDIVRSFYGKIYSKYCIEDIRSNKPWRENIFFPKT